MKNTNDSDALAITVWCLALALAALVGWGVCQAWGVEGVGPCEIDAPMEQAQCRAEEVE